MSEQDNGRAPAEDTGTPEVTEASAPVAEDPMKNFKSEVSRKFENLNSQLNQIAQSLQAQRTAETAPKPAAPQKSYRDLIYDDPEAAAELITQQAVERADRVVSAKMQRQQEMQNRIAQLTGEFPEFGSGNSEATSLATQIHASLPENLKNTAEGAELAISRAAMQLGLTPASKRRRSNDNANDGYIPAASGGGSRSRSSGPSNDSDLNSEQLTFAHLLNESIGRKMDDKTVKNLKKYAGRKDWTKFGSGEES